MGDPRPGRREQRHLSEELRVRGGFLVTHRRSALLLHRRHRRRRRYAECYPGNVEHPGERIVADIDECIQAKTASPVSVSFNGGAALTIKTNTGSDVAAGGFVASMILLGIVSGATFRIVSDQASAAIVAAAQAAAEAAAVSANIKYVPTRTALSALNTAETTLAYLAEDGREGIWEWVSGNFSTQIAADTRQGLHIKADAVAASVGAWLRVVVGIPSVKYFGAKGDDVTIDTGAFAAAFVMSKAVRVPIGKFLAEVRHSKRWHACWRSSRSISD